MARFKRKCIGTVRMNMSAMLLHQDDAVQDPIDLDKYGEWVKSQHPLTGEIVRVWRPYTNQPSTPEDESVTLGKISCMARGVADGGIRSGGTTEEFGATYSNIEYVRMWVPPRTFITKNDRVTNIAGPDGTVIWRDEEFYDPQDLTPPKATVFNVNGVTPLFDALNNHTQNFVSLERAGVVSED